MPFAILVIDRDPTLQQRRQSSGVERLGQVDRKQRLGLIEQKPAIAIGTGDQGITRRRLQGRGRSISASARVSNWSSALCPNRWRIST